MARIKFQSPNNNNLFLEDVKNDISQYFKNKNIDKYGNSEMLFKCFLWVSLWGISWYGIIYYKDSYLAAVSIGVFHMFCHLMIAFNIIHDANHNAMFKSRKLNKIFGYFIELLGSNRKLWIESHNKEHHSFVNIHNHDNNIDGHGLLRLTPHDEWHPRHKFQWIYAPLVYSLSTINYATFRDFKQIMKSEKKKPFSFYAEFVFFKALYFSYLFIIPMLIFNVSFKILISYFLIGHLINGLILSIIFIIGHLTEGTSYPEVDNKIVHENWAVHVLKTTGDFGTTIKPLQWLVGGINLHIVHHLFPTICHVHYKEVLKIIKDIASKHGIIYREIPSFKLAFISHLKLLKQLGKEPV
ncbi:MAG: fatty acid desaturase family protein [Polaribacter sp.]